MLFSFFKNIILSILLLCPYNSCCTVLEPVCHIKIFSSSLDEASKSPFILRLMPLTHSSCPFKVFLQLPPLISQYLIVWSLEALYIKFPSGENSTQLTVCSCPLRVRYTVIVSKFQIFILKSLEHEAKYFPLLSNFKQFILSLCAFKLLSSVNSSHSQIIILASSEPDASLL